MIILEKENGFVLQMLFYLHTSIQASQPEARSSSGSVSSTALLLLPQAGYTRSNRFRDSSRYTFTPSFTPKGHTPPTACPMRCSATSAASIRGFFPNRALNLGLAMRASPAHTTRATRSPRSNDSVLAMRAGSQPTASAARSTVALDTSNSITSPSRPNRARWAFARSRDIVAPFAFAMRRVGGGSPCVRLPRLAFRPPSAARMPRQTKQPRRIRRGCEVSLERATGIEPALEAWEAPVLPLNYARMRIGDYSVCSRAREESRKCFT